MKKIHLLKEDKAGTDFPSFYDAKTDTWFESSWNSDYGYPFGFWPDDYEGYHQVFSVGNAWETHVTACGKVAEIFYKNAIQGEINDDISEIEEKINDIVTNIKEAGYEWDDVNGVYISQDGDEIDLWDEADNIAYDSRFVSDYDVIHDLIISAMDNDGNIDTERLNRAAIEKAMDYDFLTQDGINGALENIGYTFASYFDMGNSEGRIWPENKMIGFYETEQPDPQHLLYIIQLLSQNEEIDVDYEDMLNYHMVFEDWRNNGEITCCTISDYVDGNYGPESYEDNDEDNDESGENIQYARQGKTQFVPHLANQRQKREFFKDFRNTRDKALYTPREKAARNLAAYHAMRYPYGENKEINSKKIYINESVLKRILLTKNKKSS